MSLSNVRTYGLDSVENNEKLFFYCHQLSASVEGLKDSINRYESYKQSKKASAKLEVDDDRT